MTGIADFRGRSFDSTAANEFLMVLGRSPDSARLLADPFTGPDGFGYRAIDLTAPGDDRLHDDATPTVLPACDTLLRDGQGLVLTNGEIERPVWVYPHGALLSFHLFGSTNPPDAYGRRPTPGEGEATTLRANTRVLLGHASDRIVPHSTRLHIDAAVGALLNTNLTVNWYFLSVMTEQPLSGLIPDFPGFLALPEETKRRVIHILSWYLPYALVSLPPGMSFPRGEAAPGRSPNWFSNLLSRLWQRR